MVKELLRYWKEYQALDQYWLETKYMTWYSEYGIDGRYMKSVEGFFAWLEDHPDLKDQASSSSK